jgi:hypothetical protein
MSYNLRSDESHRLDARQVAGSFGVVDSVDWAEATSRHEQVASGDMEWWVGWNDGIGDRRVLFRLLQTGEVRCDLRKGDEAVCCLPLDHAGPHVQATRPVILAP